jgi:hypothetical protein
MSVGGKPRADLLINSLVDSLSLARRLVSCWKQALNTSTPQRILGKYPECSRHLFSL